VGTISVLADISAVLVILEFMLLAAIPLAVLYLAVRGMHWLNEHLRPGLQQVQAGVNRVRDAVNQRAQSVARPFVAASVYAAQVQGFFDGVGQALRGKSPERFKEVQ
jgi:hypothetical protein